jgi:ketosteroid isomerase-like protein
MDKSEKAKPESMVGEWVWRFVALALLAMVGWLGWVIYQLNPNPLATAAAYAASANANKSQPDASSKNSAGGVIAPAPKPAPVAAEAPKAAPAEPPKPAAEPPKPAAEPPKPEPAKPTAEELVFVVEDWARAWTAQDPDAYLAFYAPDFKTPGGEPRAAWEKGRRLRIATPKSITLTVENAKVEFDGDDKASVTFRQLYKSDIVAQSATSKTLVLVRADGRWKIQQEIAGR